MTRIHAAGAALWRETAAGVEVAVTHRPRYDDWSLPKGKVDPGEPLPETAVREIAEETGYRAVLGRLLPAAHYEVSTEDGGRRPKTVTYYSAEAVSGEFAANEEVDELRWLPPAQARELLSYPHDRTVLDAFTELPARTRTVLLVRHAKAGKRGKWDGPDELRPLTASGLHQARCLAAWLPPFAPARLYAAPRVRCVQTLEPLAARLPLAITEEWLLAEEGFWPDPDAGVRRFLAITAGQGVAVVSSQGGVIPELVQRLAVKAGLPLTEFPSRKGSIWILTFDADPAAPTLLAADYCESPLPPLR
ncbi:NUDIX hydrolase [Crossiella sp. SN42]|uniref:NUDIX hydrolase n=1 Tax=Crossiella sp. SN42 TaxID=2944808 RepID=UPI00207CDE4F|nr:NUDIX hydrolase [Crossiella sp. SN42]MCO1580859.1 NUDIX hydrolase [Crossiella sp. SN42]